MSTSHHIKYHNYLKERTLKSKLYRKYLLYPKISKFMTGMGLDLGAGIGDFLAFRPATVGVDIIPENVDYCKAQGLECYLMEIDVLPFQDDEFDSIIMDNVLEHILDPLPILAEIDRVLKKDGVLVVGVPGILGFTRDLDHKIFYSKEDLTATFVNRDYAVERIFSMPFESAWLDAHLSQYCYYGVFRKS